MNVRQGNLLIGGEGFLSEYFSEKRFSVWCVGEVHVSNEVKVNARRDGFEHTEEYEVLVEQFGILGEYISNLCRKSSSERSKMNNSILLSNQVQPLKDFSVAVNSTHKKKIEELILKSNVEAPKEIINKIVFLEDLIKKGKTKELDANVVLNKISRLLVEELNNPLLTASMLSKLAKELEIQ
jgi:hypothetical protein